MATRSSFKKNNSAVKRIMQEARELADDPSTEYSAAPLDDNLFEWHCTMRGPAETDFEGGLYHFRIILPAEYPFRPPSLVMLTPSGRFETNKQICISFTNYHEDLWQPAWGVRTAIIGLQGFFALKGQAAMGVGSLEAPSCERRRLAKLSRDWECPQCQRANHESIGMDQQSTASASALASASASSSAPSPLTADEQAPTPSAVADASNSNSNSNSNSKGSPALSAQHLTHPASHPISADIPTPTPTTTATTTSTAPTATPAGGGRVMTRPPVMLDAAIAVLLVFVAALLCRKAV